MNDNSRGDLALETSDQVSGAAPSEIEPRKATQRTPRAIPAGFDPLETCPEDRRHRWEKRALVAHAQPMKAIELKCLECCAWERPEAARCEIRGCALWAFNQRLFGGGGAL